MPCFCGQNNLMKIESKKEITINLKKAGVGQPKYCNNAYVHVVLTNLCSIFSIFKVFFGLVTTYFDPT